MHLRPLPLIMDECYMQANLGLWVQCAFGVPQTGDRATQVCEGIWRSAKVDP